MITHNIIIRATLKFLPFCWVPILITMTLIACISIHTLYDNNQYSFAKVVFFTPLGTGNTEERNESDSHSICQPINRTETETVAQPEPSTGTSRSIELLSNQESCDVKQDDSRSDNNENEHCNVKIKVHDNLENNEIKIEEGKSLKSSPITVDINVRLVPRSGKSRPK